MGTSHNAPTDGLLERTVRIDDLRKTECLCPVQVGS